MKSRKEARQIKPFNLGELPEEILILIFTFLDPNSIFTLSFVSKTFRDLSQDPSFAWWKAEPQKKIFIEHTDVIQEFLITEIQGKKVVMIRYHTSPYVISRDLQTGELLHQFEGYKYRIKCMAIFQHHEKTLLATGSLDNTIRIWDIETGKGLKILKGHAYQINCITTFANNGKTFLVSGSLDETIRIWEWEEEKCLQILEGHQQEITHLQILPEEKPLIVSASSDGTLGVWDPETGECRQEIKKDSPTPITYLGISKSLQDLYFFKNPYRIIYCYLNEAHIHQWNPNDKPHPSEYVSFSTNPPKPSPFRFPYFYSSEVKSSRRRVNNNGRSFLQHVNKDIKILGPCKTTPYTLEHDTQRVEAIFLKKNKKYFLVSIDQTNLYIWNLQTGACLRKLKVCPPKAFYVSNLILIPGTHGSFQIMCKADSKIITLTFWPYKTNTLDLQPDEKNLNVEKIPQQELKKSENNIHGTHRISPETDRFYNATPKPHFSLLKKRRSRIRQDRFEPNAPSAEPTKKESRKIHLQESEKTRKQHYSNSVNSSLSKLPEEILFQIIQYLFNADIFTISLLSKQFRHLSQDPNLAENYWRWLTVRPQHKIFVGHKDLIEELQFIQLHEQTVAVISDGSSNYLVTRDLQTGKLLHKFNFKYNRSCFESTELMTIFQDKGETLLATGFSDQTIRISNLATGKHLKTLRGDTLYTECITTFSDNEKTFLVSGSSDYTIRIWDWKEEKCLRILKGHQGAIIRLQILPEEKPLIVSASLDKTVRIWDPKTGKCQQEIKNPGDNLLTYLGISRGVKTSFHSPGKYRIVCCYLGDNPIYHWNPYNGTCISDPVFFPFTSLKPNPFHFPRHYKSIKILSPSKTLYTLLHEKVNIQAILLKKNEDYFLVSIDNKNLYIWNLKTGKCLQKLEICHPRAFCYVSKLTFIPGIHGSFQIICKVDNKIITFTFDPRQVNTVNLQTDKKDLNQEKVLPQETEKTQKQYYFSTGYTLDLFRHPSESKSEDFSEEESRFESEDSSESENSHSYQQS